MDKSSASTATSWSYMGFRAGEIIWGFCKFPPHVQRETTNKEKLCGVFGINLVGLGFWGFKWKEEQERASPIATEEKTVDGKRKVAD